MRKLRTDEEVKAEIAKLREYKLKIPKRTVFGDDNMRAVDVEIEVLEKRMTENDIYANYDDPEEEEGENRELDMARSALQWLELDSDESPSSGWEHLAK